jgi:hypothetical protein
MNIGSPLITTGAPIPQLVVEPEFDQTDIPTYRSDYRFSGCKLDQTDLGIVVQNVDVRHQPSCWSFRATYGYEPKLMNP